MGNASTAFLGGYLAVLLIVLIVQAVAFGIAGALILAPLENQGAGFALGLFLGPIGLVIAWAMRANGLLELELKEKQRAARAPTVTPAREPGEPRRFK